MNKKTVRDVDVRGRGVLVRVDFNVPLDKATGAITDDARIRGALPTIAYLREHGGRVILCSHLGRPKGVDERLRLSNVARRLGELIGAPVATTSDCVGAEAAKAAGALADGQVLVLENLRFHPEEEQNDPTFARELASLAEIYVNDAFGAAHRAHASTVGVAAYLPAVAGMLLEKEIDYLGKALSSPDRPFAVIMGGAKISDKIGVLTNLIGRADRLLIGGGMANTFLKAQGHEIGDSLAEEGQLDAAQTLMEQASGRGVTFLLPIDVVIGDRFADDAQSRVVRIDGVEPGWRILDIGPRTIEAYANAIADCRTVVWNGPMGVFEFPAFANGTVQLAAALGRVQGTTIVGGGETAAAVEQAGVAGRLSHVSTGGGAALEFLEGRDLPGVTALNDKDRP